MTFVMVNINSTANIQSQINEKQLHTVYNMKEQSLACHVLTELETCLV